MKITGGQVRLVDLADDAGRIHDVHCDGVRLLGPGVALAVDGTSMEDCAWDDGGFGAEAIVWEIDPARPAVVGAIGLHACSFVRCTFSGIGYAGNAESVGKFFQAAHPGPRPA